MKNSMYKLTKELENLGTYLQMQDIIALQVSKAGVYWHIQHSLLTVEKIFESLQESNPDSYTSSFTIGKLFVLTTGIIPRGRAESPISVRPVEQYMYEQIKEEVQKIQKLLPLFGELPARAYFEHPFLGKLKRDEAIAFLAIHTRHHIKIIKDILRH